MIRFEDVSVTYDGAAGPIVTGVDFEVPEGELVLLAGPSGVGKSTVLGAVSGLVPHFTGGTLRGRVTVAGRDHPYAPAASSRRRGRHGGPGRSRTS
ncbi:ATP-binding cassette domain-containing protein [Streptomyces dangxiongensis]|uniref:ATP-binding cassette domain-containing protein n=1 Tax=Streptomyces dangxiongensis TaxID=1442032 RepID=UPI00267DE72E